MPSGVGRVEYSRADDIVDRVKEVTSADRAMGRTMDIVDRLDDGIADRRWFIMSICMYAGK
jgi:hypothetical protein